jgi:pimeloyl-ACP methyl ester carboxylesterase
MEALALARKMPQEAITLRSRDGLALRARLYDTPDAIGSILLFHGYRSFGECDFGCILSYYRDTRHLRVLLVYQRAHGDSEGKYITFGDLERHDCVDWARYIADRFGEQPIILDGMSMGAATVLLAAGETLPKNVVGILADCAYSSAEGILRAVGEQMKMPVGLILPGVRFLCRAVGHFDPLPVSVPKALSKSTLPVLLIHGTADSFVPHAMGVENSRAREDIRLVSVEGADHGMGYLINPTLVIKELDAFFDRVLG